MNNNQEPTNEEISVCAYYLWESAGRPNGRDQDFWNKAKTELTGPQKADKASAPLNQMSDAQPRGTNISTARSAPKKKATASRTPAFA